MYIIQLLHLQKHRGREVHVHNPGLKIGSDLRRNQGFFEFDVDQHVGCTKHNEECHLVFYFHLSQSKDGNRMQYLPKH